MRLARSWVCACAGVLRFVEAQPNIESNYSICNWARLRAGVVRDAVYLDGGLLWWQTALADGSTPVVSSDGNADGDMYKLSLSRAFDTTSTNLSAMLEPMSKAGGAGNNIAPNYVDGTMFTNDGELYMYGGLPRLTDSSSGQTADTVLGYEAFQYGPQRDSWSPGFYQGSTGDNVTRYVTNGAGVSAPSENLGFYFGGLRSPHGGPIHYEDSSANTTSDVMIQVDMSTMREEVWTNLTIPSEIRPRVNGELVWLPVSERGVLAVIGGVTSTEEIYPAGLNESQRSESETVSPSFMTQIPIYDIASEQWYVQNITGSEAPPQLTQFCSVVAVDEEAGSFNVYIYGGYDGLDSGDTPMDDVWVLSLPDFTWTKVYEGTEVHGRSGHHCVSPYPDKMFIIGGVHKNQANCLDGGFIQVFNLNTLKFQDTYRPDEWEEYSQPTKIGNARRLGKRQVEWTSEELANLFSQKYTREVQHYYPYESDNTFVGNENSDSKSGSSVNTVAIAVGVSIGVFIILVTIILFCILRRKGWLRAGSSMSSRTKRSRISQWIHGTMRSPAHTKSFDDDSTSDFNREVEQQYSSASAQASSESSARPVVIPPPTNKSQPQEMSAVDRPHPPFELATPYNAVGQPRNSNTVDFGYKATTGHNPESITESISRSASSDGQRPAPPLQAPTSYDDIVKEARASVDRLDDTSSSDTSSPAWPLPATRPNWSRNNSASSSTGDSTAHLLSHNQPNVPQVPSQYRSVHHDTAPSRLRPVLPSNEVSNASSSGPSSQSHQDSTVSSLVSPINEADSHTWDAEQRSGIARKPVGAATQRQSLMNGISPIVEEEGRHAPWLQSEPQAESRRSGEGRERWWS
jgi:hypothetical protein